MNKTHILIVEDEGIVAKDLQGMLRRMGYHVPTIVGTGELAIQTAAQNKPDLILMDIQLRGAMDGVEAATAIGSSQDIPIVYLTANSDEATLQRAKATGPFGFLVKPFEERAIQAGIEMAIYKCTTDRQTRERERWLTTTLTSIADAVITTDPAGRITFLNASAEKLSGWRCSEAVGRLYGEVFCIVEEASRQRPVDRIALALRDAQECRIDGQTLLIRADNSEVAIEYSVAPIRQGPGVQLDGCVIVFSDVSGRKELEDQLRQSQKLDAIGKLAGGIAHDFNNAITAIVGYAELMLLQVDQGNPVYLSAKQIVRAAEHSARLTHQLLAFTRKQVLQPRSLSLHEELTQIEGMIRRLIGETISLTVEPADELWNVLADAGQIQQVVLNMSINARDAMPSGGELRLEMCNASISPAEAARIPDGVPGDYVLLTITDTGTGMSAETVKRIFEPFFTTKGPGKGTGLGLATCHGIVKQTGGMLTLTSAVGVGTTFSIYLPKAEHSADETDSVPVEAVMPGNETVLLVEDEEILRELGFEVLQSLGYCVLTAANGEEAVQILSGEARGRINLVATDMVMPRMNGRELSAWIHKNASHLPVLFMSGYTDDEIVRSAVQGAAVEFLQKPFTPDTLARKVRQVLAARDCPAATVAA